MIQDWINAMKIAIINATGVVEADAKALALSGFGQLLQANTGNISAADWNTYITNNYAMSIADVLNIVGDYMNGDNGRTSCF